MLEHFFSNQTRLRQLRRGPLGPHMDTLAAELHSQGYVNQTGRFLLNLAGHLSTFARVEGVAVSDISDEFMGRFIEEELRVEGGFRGAENAMLHMARFLDVHGLRPQENCLVEPEPHDDLMKRVDVYVIEVKGLAETSRLSYRRELLRFLEWFEERGKFISELTGQDVLAFLAERLENPANPRVKQNRCSWMRIILRFLHWEGILKEDLTRVVPKVPRWRLAEVPRHLPWEDVEAIIESVDIAHPDGLRDKAILLMVAKLGLRSREVRSIEFGDVSWRKGELLVRKAKSGKERRLPLPEGVGAALADYVLHGRPTADTKRIFLRHKAPIGPLDTSSAIAAIVRKHLKRAGISTRQKGKGAHLLRHSLATRMINQSVPIKDIADVLGHTSIDTTAIYTKVDMTRLKLVVVPFPQEVPHG